MHYAGRGSFEDAPSLLRDLLRNATEKVIIVQTGFSTNLAALLNSQEDIALIQEKVAFVVAMAGNFADGAPEYNVRIDVPSAKAVFETGSSVRLSFAQRDMLIYSEGRLVNDRRG